MSAVTASLTAENTFTDWYSSRYDNADGYLNLSVSGTWVGTITVQRSFDGGVTPLDVEQYTSNIEKYVQDFETGVVYRIGFKTGEFTSGTAVCRVSR